ncbi:MAG: AAA-like domain-containing protein [Candidatus Aminicenantes bacterium]|nr:AAA-like domain-containing protein [Candidatus Aminicenantes bacterium]
MVDIANKTALIFEMIERGDYFVVNRPRQYGKTTIIYSLNRFLNTAEHYFPIKMSFEGIGSDSYRDEAKFIAAFLLRLKRVFKIAGNNGMVKFIEASADVDCISKLDIWLTELITKIGEKVVLMIDEVDKNIDNQLFLDFIGLLRDKFLRYNAGEEVTFHSAILVGIHDVKTLKVKLRPDENAKYNSPWNIAVDFEVDLSFSAGEIASMLEEYAQAQRVEIDVSFFADQLFYFTSGYPFLVSYLCKMIDEKILPHKRKKEWQPHDLIEAVRTALLKNNTNFQDVIKNLENNPDLYEFVFKIIMNGREFSYNPHNAIINFGTIYGILKEEKGKVKVHNRLYEQLIYDYMSSNLETSGGIEIYDTGGAYIEADGTLNIEKAIRRFQLFMKEQYSVKDTDFIERNDRLLFLTFIKPIINGRGFDFKEVQVSEEKRLDVVITFKNKKHIVELKIWRGESYHRAGIEQLCDYLERQGETTGYLLIYDLRKESGRAGEWEKIETGGKKIFAAWI